MKAFRNVAIITALGVYGQIVLGGVVRITGSGLGCRDWPLCSQHESDRFAYRTLIEVTHRLFGTVTGFAVVATLVVAIWLYRRRQVPRQLAITAGVLLFLYGVQALLGGLTVLAGNRPWTVALHLGNSLLVLGLAVTVALWAARLTAGTGTAVTAPDLLTRLVASSAVMTYAVVITGAFVVGTGASAACSSWPLCGSRRTPLADVHMLHRVFVLVAAVLFVITLRQARQQWRGTPMVAAVWFGAAAFALEVAVGASQVLLSLPAPLRAIHLALATAVWGIVILLAAALWLDRAQMDHEQPRRPGLARVGAAS